MKRFYDVEFKLIFFNGIKKKKHDPNKKIINGDKQDIKNLVIDTVINVRVEVDIPEDRSKKEVLKSIKDKVASHYEVSKRDHINKKLAENHRNFYGFGLFKINEVQSDYLQIRINSIQDWKWEEP